MLGWCESSACPAARLFLSHSFLRAVCRGLRKVDLWRRPLSKSGRELVCFSTRRHLCFRLYGQGSRKLTAIAKHHPGLNVIAYDTVASSADDGNSSPFHRFQASEDNLELVCHTIYHVINMFRQSTCALFY